jgi:hypothetical protein
MHEERHFPAVGFGASQWWSHPDSVLLEVTLTTGRFPSTNPPEVESAVKSMLLALRVLATEPIMAGLGWRVSDDWFLQVGGIMTGLSALPIGFAQRFVLTEELASSLPTLYQRAQGVIQAPELETVLTRLNDSYTRTKNEDKLLDYWGALESLFLPIDGREELRQSVSLAISNYIGDNSNEREEIRRLTLDSYDWRSYFVHGKRLAPGRKLRHTEEDVTEKTGEYFRRALRKRLME